MNLKDKFIWNLAIGISSFAIIWSAWNLYILNTDTTKLYNKFLSDSKNIGTDDDLESKVLELETNYKFRDNMQFKISSDPSDLNRVFVIGGGKGSKRKKNLYANGIINRGNGRLTALMNFKDQPYMVEQGDSIAGGLITKITTTEVVYNKNNKEYIFNLSLKNTLE
tara:strand:- start:211 stop:708 length:498 start_codon:yes stop_codon:yes gene_type:complete